MTEARDGRRSHGNEMERVAATFRDVMDEVDLVSTRHPSLYYHKHPALNPEEGSTRGGLRFMC